VVIVADSLMPASKRAGRLLESRLARRGVPVFYTHSTRAVKLTVRPTGAWHLAGVEGASIDGREVR
jgi:hypothetical protein